MENTLERWKATLMAPQMASLTERRTALPSAPLTDLHLAAMSGDRFPKGSRWAMTRDSASCSDWR